MRVVLGATPLLAPMGGIRRYIKELSQALKCVNPDIQLKYLIGFLFSKPPVKYGFSFKLLLRFKSLARKIGLMNLIRNIHLNAMNKDLSYSFDLYIETNYIPSRTINARKIFSVVHDFSTFKYPEWHPKDRVKFFEKNFWREIERADLIILVSKSIKEEAIELGLPLNKLRVVYPGINSVIFHPLDQDQRKRLRTKKKLPERFILYVGAIEPRKNLKRLIEAYSMLPNSLRERFPLLVVGSSGWNNEDIFDILRRKNINLILNPNDEDLLCFYNLANLFIFPSLYEGFGFTPLEALACGCPVLLSDIPVFRELYGDLVPYFNPYDSYDISQVLRNTLEDLDSLTQSQSNAMNFARSLSWDNTARTILKLYEEITS